MRSRPHDHGSDPRLNCATGLGGLPRELIAAILDGVGDRDYCHCLQAGAVFWGASSDAAVETRKRRWRGCREPHDFCATGNVEALALLSARDRAFDVRLCVVNGLAHGHGDVVLDFLQDAGRVGDDNSTIDGEWHQDACREAAKHGRLDVLATLWYCRPLGADTIIDGAAQGDRLDVFLWACEARGFPPARRDVREAITHGAVAILTHCRRSVPIPQAEWSQMASAMAGHPCRIDALLLLMGDDTPRQTQKNICSAMCSHAPLQDIKTLYSRFPDAFGKWCLVDAVRACDIEVARWLCARHPEWVNQVVSLHVGLGRPDAMMFIAGHPHGVVERLYHAGLIADVPGLVRIAAARGALALLALVIDAECRKHLSLDSPADDVRWLSRDHHSHLPADIISAATMGALARLSSAANDRGPYDWLDERGLVQAVLPVPSP